MTPIKAEAGYLLNNKQKCSNIVKELNGFDLSVKNERKSKMCAHFPLYNCRNPFIKKEYLWGSKSAPNELSYIKCPKLKSPLRLFPMCVYFALFRAKLGESPWHSEEYRFQASNRIAKMLNKPNKT